VAWTRPEQIHLTLNFIGNVQREGVAGFEQAVEAASLRGQRHVLRVGGLGCFPSLLRARIIWAGLSGDGAALAELKRFLDESLERLGCVPEKRPFQPHLTIGRVKQWNSGDKRLLAGALPPWAGADFGSCAVERLDLMQSVLSPAGAKYALVRSCPLPGPTAA
jgi:2'-5' RNA ligase